MKRSFWPVLILLSIAGAAQQPPKTEAKPPVITDAQAPKAPVTPAAPVVTDAQKLAYFKARAEAGEASTQAQQAAQAAQQKQVVLQEAVKAITDACGKEFVPQFDAAGNPVCAVKPAEVPAAKK